MRMHPPRGQGGVPRSYVLLPVFPNPVSQELIVFYLLPEASYVEVRIVDEYMRTPTKGLLWMLGRKLAFTRFCGT